MQRINYISQLLKTHEANGSHGSREVHILSPANWNVRLLHRWQLTHFPEPKALWMEQDTLRWVTDEQSAGWVIPEAAVIMNSSSIPIGRVDLFMISDGCYATAGRGIPDWVRTKERILIPDDRLHPLLEAPETIDLETIARTLWRLLPTDIRHDPDYIPGATSDHSVRVHSDKPV